MTRAAVRALARARWGAAVVLTERRTECQGHDLVARGRCEIGTRATIVGLRVVEVKGEGDTWDEAARAAGLLEAAP